MATASDHAPGADSDVSLTVLPCVLDIEASGFGRGSYPIEIGFVLPDGTAYCTLIVPDQSWTHWDGDAERVHGISRSLLKRHGRSAAEVAAELNQRLHGRAVYCDNWAHDYAWLARLFESADISPSFQLRHLRELLGEHAGERFDDAREIVARNLQLRRHRASSDARVLQLSLAKVWQNGAAPANDSPPAGAVA
ncbi:MAG: hypothetical protein ABJD97_09115 [Betaproteobacteria bacterium]